MFYKNRACQHLRLLGYSPTDSSRFASLIQKWHDASGPEWTAKRLKALEQYAKDRMVGRADLSIPEGWAKKSTRRFKERFSDDLLHELFSSSNFSLEKALHFTRLSSGILMATRDKRGSVKQMPPSKEQLKKVLTAVEGPVDKDINRDIMNSVDSALGLSMKNYPSHSNLDVIPMLYWPKTDVTAPFRDEFGKIQTASRNTEQRVWSLDILYSDYSFARFLDNNLRFATDCVIGKGSELLPRPNPGSAIFSIPAGAYSFIQELGAKIRPVANPFLAVQAINEPLKLQLKRISRTIPEIVTYDQDEGRNQLKQWLESQTKVWSLDASSFTDRFPLEFQLKVLKLLLSNDKITQEMYDAFSVTSSHPYFSKHLGRNIHYKFGQGQGLGPSFNVATIAHYELLEAFRISLGLDPGLFKLVGDDVIIANERLAHSYQVWMDACNVEINMSKSIISNSLGEFAGASVTQNSVIMRPKLSEVKSNDSVVSLFELYQESDKRDRFINTMYDEYEKYSRKFHLPEDFGGKRLHVYLSDVNPLELNDFAVQKARMLKEIKKFVPYNQKDVIKFLNNKEWVKTGILHSSDQYIDDPGLTEDFDYLQREVSQTCQISALNKGQIQDFVDLTGALMQALSASKSEKDLRVIAQKFIKLMDKNGYLKENDGLSLIPQDFQYQLAKLVSVDTLDINSKDAATRRKLKSRPTNTGWSKLLQ